MFFTIRENKNKIWVDVDQIAAVLEDREGKCTILYVGDHMFYVLEPIADIVEFLETGYISRKHDV